MKVNPKNWQTYVWIPARKFMMGCSPGAPQCDDDEKPTREVTIAQGFWIGQTLVTKAAFKRVTGENPMVAAWRQTTRSGISICCLWKARKKAATTSGSNSCPALRSRISHAS